MSRRPGAKGHRDRTTFGFPTPRLWVVQGLFAGAYRRHKPTGEGAFMHAAADGMQTLEQRTVAAHRAYLDALIVLERIAHAETCPECASIEFTDVEQTQAYATADARKEVCRTAFRDLLGQLGHIPRELTAALPKGEAWCTKQATNIG
jgi:hypothetical protein